MRLSFILKLNQKQISVVPRSVFSDEEVEQGEGDGVAREHVVAARSNTLQRHSCASPAEQTLIYNVVDH